jgi:cell wall-associated NlpC family hydrolase
MRLIEILIFALMTSVASAAPPDAPDEIEQLLTDKGVLTQIQEIGLSVTQKASGLVVYAIGFLGMPYRFGGSNVEVGFDCSGFVKSMYQQTVGLILPRKAEQQAAATQRIEQRELQPGDLVFFNTLRRAFSHVGIYIGDGKFVHSPKPGAEVRIDSMNLAYWRDRFDGARRVQFAAQESTLRKP